MQTQLRYLAEVGPVSIVLALWPGLLQALIGMSIERTQVVRLDETSQLLRLLVPPQDNHVYAEVVSGVPEVTSCCTCVGLSSSSYLALI